MSRTQLKPIQVHHTFSKRDVRLLDVEELRKLVNVCNNTNESWNTGRDETEVMDAQGILDLHWAAEDAGGWDGFGAWWENERIPAQKAWNRIQKRAQARLSQYAGEPTGKVE